MARLKVFPMALSLGITWGAGMLLLGWISVRGWGAKVVEILSSLYIGFVSTFWGGVIGSLWGFADAFLAGLFFALLYNAFAGRRLPQRATILGQSEQPAH